MLAEISETHKDITTSQKSNNTYSHKCRNMRKLQNYAVSKRSYDSDVNISHVDTTTKYFVQSNSNHEKIIFSRNNY